MNLQSPSAALVSTTPPRNELCAIAPFIVDKLNGIEATRSQQITPERKITALTELLHAAKSGQTPGRLIKHQVSAQEIQQIAAAATDAAINCIARSAGTPGLASALVTFTNKLGTLTPPSIPFLSELRTFVSNNRAHFSRDELRDLAFNLKAAEKMCLPTIAYLGKIGLRAAQGRDVGGFRVDIEVLDKTADSVTILIDHTAHTDRVDNEPDEAQREQQPRTWGETLIKAAFFGGRKGYRLINLGAEYDNLPSSEAREAYLRKILGAAGTGS